MGETGTAKLFKHGRSQAVRLPKKFRMPGTQVRVAESINPANVLWSFPSNGSPHPYQQSLPAGQYDLADLVRGLRGRLVAKPQFIAIFGHSL